MKQCPICGHQNSDDARFCCICQHEFKAVKKNVMEQYPELNLESTNFFDWGRSKPIAIYVLLTISFIFYPWLFAISESIDNYNEYLEYEYLPNDSIAAPDFWNWICSDGSGYNKYLFVMAIVLTILATTLSLLVMTFFNKSQPKTHLKDVADYVQKYVDKSHFHRSKTRLYTFYVKDQKFGVLDYAHYKVAVPAEYDYLEWHTPKKYLKATLNGENFIIDINGNRLK